MLTYYYDPMGASKRDVRELDLSLTLLENLERHFPNGLDAETHRFILNGQEINPFEYDLNRPVTTFDCVDIIKRQQGLGEGAMAIISMIVAIAAAAAILLTPRPNIPNDAGSTKDSPNNRLTGQTNIARLYQAKPDIYGRCRVYPDLVGAAIPEYINHTKMVTQMMCVGMGNYDVHSVRFADNDLSQIKLSEYQVFNPNDVIDEEQIAYPTPEVDGQEIEYNLVDAKNPVFALSTYNNKVDKAELYIAQYIFKVNATPDILLLSEKNLPLRVFVSAHCNWVDTHWSSEGNGGSGSRASYYVTCGRYYAYLSRIEIQGDIAFLTIVDMQRVDLSFLNPTDFQGAVGRVEVSGTGNGKKRSFENAYGQAKKYKGFTIRELQQPEHFGPFILNEPADQLWFNIIYPRGLKATVKIIATWYKLNDKNEEITGTRETRDIYHSANTLESRYFTEKITPKSGRGRYAVMFQRVTGRTEDQNPSNSKLEWLAAIQVRKNARAKDTLIRVRQKATEHATSHKESKINLDVTRKTLTYDAKTGKIDYNLRPSRSFADAILHSWVVMADKPPERLNLDELYTIAQSLPKKELGYFDFSFDDKDISLGQRVQTICNAARVAVSKDGLQYRFIRNQRIEVPRYQFDGRNLAKNGGTMSYKFSEPSSFDGVELEYVDAKVDNPEKGTDKKAFIRLKINRETGAITEGECRRPYKVQLAGCRNKFQAMNRAQLEARVLLYNRLAVDDTALSDAAYLPIGSRVRYVDTYDSAVVSGEIMNINNGVFITNTEIVLDPSKQYKVCITDEHGKPSPWIPFNQVDKKSFSAAYASAFTANGYDIQCGSRFIIACEKSEKLDFILTDKKPSSNNVGVSLSVYDDRVYEYDDRTLPFKQWSKQH